MGLARDSSPEASQASGPARLPRPARVWLRPLSTSEPRVSSGSRGDSPRSRDTLPASMSPSMASPPSGRHPEACHVPHGPALRRHPSPGIGLRHPCCAGPLGHKAITTTRISMHVLTRGGVGARSPVDVL